MRPRDLVLAVLRGHDLAVRQYVKDAAREGFSWGNAPPPDFTGLRARAVYAAVVDLLSSRAGETPPAWTGAVERAPKPIFLVRMAKTSKVLRRESMRTTPELLKKRNVYALEDYLDVV